MSGHDVTTQGGAPGSTSTQSDACPESVLPKIVQVGHPVLRQRAKIVPVHDIPTPRFQQLIDTMIEVMRKATGVGLAAPQIGVSQRVIVLGVSEERMARTGFTEEEKEERGEVVFGPIAIINPELVIEESVDKKPPVYREGCLSLSGYTAEVERHNTVTVTGLDRDAKPFTWTVSGWPARILQHEVDHINGMIYIDRMNSRTFADNDQLKANDA